ncbi:MAG: AMP-binding protein [Gammaproteobacteria bacterium]|nr:AMP-binding protein [Gammaproteobacteria bacterium]MDH3534492.1 AMP-binding protein [Gammaproteobacteria bacterium]
MSEYYDSLETRSADERAQAQFAALREQIEHVQNDTAAYATSLKGVHRGDIIDAESFSKLPLTRKSELIELQQSERPFGGYTARNIAHYSHVFASPGPIYEPGYAVPDFWRFARSLHASGFRQGDLVHNTFSYHFTPAGQMFDSAAAALGCAVIPAGVGQTELQVQTIADLKPDAYVGTPSFLKIILEEADRLGSDVSSISKAMMSGEALPPPLRDGFSERGIRVQQCYGTADLGLIAYESSAREGLIIDEGVYVEIVRPGTGELVDEGEVGEVVVTSLGQHYPLIRFATGDLSAILSGESPCGRTNLRIKGWMGRADQTAKVRGMFIHPEQVDKVIKRHSEIAKARLIVDWVEQADQITLQCESESSDASLPAAIADSIRSICKLRGAVEIVAPGALPNDGKVIDDIRSYD